MEVIEFYNIFQVRVEPYLRELKCIAAGLIHNGAICQQNDVFLWDFRRNKAVKFNRGQYINNTLEGGPWAPILVGGYFTGADVIWEYTVDQTNKCINTTNI